MTSPTSATSAQQLINSFNQAGKQTSATEGLQDRFLKLLVTQMKNQDPSDPMDNQAFLAQLDQLADSLAQALDGQREIVLHQVRLADPQLAPLPAARAPARPAGRPPRRRWPTRSG